MIAVGFPRARARRPRSSRISQKVGAAAVALTQGADGLAILGLPLMNGYFTVFDGEADGGRGTINFATIKAP